MDVLEKAQGKIAALQSAVGRLYEQRDQIQKQLAATEMELAKLVGFVDTYRQLEARAEDLGLAARSEPPATRTLRMGPRQLEVIAEAYLKESAPKKTAEIVAFLELKGCVIPSSQKEAYLAGVLSRSEKFVARRRLGGWFLKANDPDPHNPLELPEVTADALRAEFELQKGETPSVGAEGVSDTSTQAAIDGGGSESDGLL